MRPAKERVVNRKMASVLKGSGHSLDRIEVPKFEWYYLAVKAELYHHDKGMFESYTAYSSQFGIKPTNPTKLFTHHHLKVLPEEAV